MNSFESQVVKMVREDMSDEQILEMARAELSAPLIRGTQPAEPKASPVPVYKIESVPKRKRVRRAKPKAKRKAFDPGSAELVFGSVKKARKGVAMGDVEAATKLPRAHVQRAIGELVAKRRLYKAGERRFTRYATNKAAAVKASKAR